MLLLISLLIIGVSGGLLGWRMRKLLPLLKGKPLMGSLTVEGVVSVTAILGVMAGLSMLGYWIVSVVRSP